MHLQSEQWTCSISWVLSRTHSHISIHCACVAVIHSPYRRNFLHFLHLCRTCFTAHLLVRISWLLIQAEGYTALFLALKTGPALLCRPGPVRHDPVSHPPRFHTLPLYSAASLGLGNVLPAGPLWPRTARHYLYPTFPFAALYALYSSGVSSLTSALAPSMSPATFISCALSTMSNIDDCNLLNSELALLRLYDL